ncbi:unnamed protein product [Spirodela intermedia]|uniref:RING-type domain-containing protein n=1 Tax=Spirodela intermedia TaxID=51605 RepID=A0A7I8JKK5_SPIIN|nr:unnamed protein product [Spirodela intermedia]CAA6670716.1 unnamed protein product [Spirodela intermedia]
MRVSRARWYAFLRRVFRHQNGPVGGLIGQPFASVLVQLAVAATTVAVAAARGERPAWPLKIWLAGYSLGNLLSLALLLHRLLSHRRRPSAGNDAAEKGRTVMELFHAVWFVMGNIWLLDSRWVSSGQAPALYALGLGLLAWNAAAYAFPFLVFLLLCCCVPIASAALGYNINLAADNRGASDEDLARLPHWAFQEKEEVRELPCAHMFHLNCVDHWLKIIACCPLCKQELER